MALIYVCLSVAVFIYPQLGVRQRIRQEKVRVYLGLTGMLPNSTQAIVQSASNPERLSALLSSRAQVQALPEWPTGAGQHARLRLSAFMVIPLLSWVAAALVERLISWLLV